MLAPRFTVTLAAAIHLLLTHAPVSAQTFSEPESPVTIRLGATLPLTGEYASYGNLIRDGVEFAVSDLRAKGVAVETFYEDIAAPGPNTASAIRKLVTADKINALVANFWNGAIPTMAPVLMQHQIPTFHTAAADDLILGSGDYIFSTNSKIADEARQNADHAFANLGARTAAVIFIETNWGENYARHFATRFEELGGKVILTDSSALGSMDLRAMLLRVRGSNPDVVFAPYFGTNLGIVLKQARELGMKPPILSVYEAEDPSVLETAEASAEGLQFFIAEPERDSAEQTTVARRFAERFGYQPRILGRNAYDATMLMVQALTECKRAPVCTKEKLYGVKSYHGLSGTLTIDPDGAATKDFVLKTVANRTFVQVPGWKEQILSARARLARPKE